MANSSKSSHSESLDYTDQVFHFSCPPVTTPIKKATPRLLGDYGGSDSVTSMGVWSDGFS